MAGWWETYWYFWASCCLWSFVIKVDDFITTIVWNLPPPTSANLTLIIRKIIKEVVPAPDFKDEIVRILEIKDFLISCHISCDTCCVLCDGMWESAEHFFFYCPYSILSRVKSTHVGLQAIRRLIFLAYVWKILRESNLHIFQDVFWRVSFSMLSRSPNQLLHCITMQIHSWIATEPDRLSLEFSTHLQMWSSSAQPVL